MLDSIKKRIDLVRDAEDPADLKKHLCPFFEKGGHTDCITCRRCEEDLDECRDYYLSRIALIPMDIWTPEFDKILVQDRDKVDLSEIVGVGINCDSCYMSDKCPLFKAGYTCAIRWDDDRPKTPAEFMDFLINTQYERIKRSAVFEKLDGGVPDANLSGEMDRLTNFLSMKDSMGRDRLSINVEASSAQSGGGILSKLFGVGASTPAVAPAEAPRAIEAVDAEVVEEKPKVVVEVKSEKQPKKKELCHT